MGQGGLAELPEADWNRLQATIATYENLWKRGDRPRIADHLPADDPHRETLLIELVHAELEFRLKAKEPARVEDYLRRYPSLARDRSTVLGLIQAEWTIRRRGSPKLTFDRFRERFPDFTNELALAPPDASTVAGIEGSNRLECKLGGDPAPSAELALPRKLGKFLLRERVGAGSFGVVYRAWDTVLGREVAVKLPKPGVMKSPAEVQVFLREARNAIHLKHPNIVAILDAGPIEETVCVIRDFIEGETLTNRVREAPFTPEQAAALLIFVADALDYAHQKGIIHRDLKPSNILLDHEGQPYVVDFGLAKREASDSTLSPSKTGASFIGTPAYMPPEQARGEASKVDARSDVYSAGVILYELLTGAPPFRGRGRMLQIQIEVAPPTPPRDLNEDVPKDLETICLRALAKAPVDRYPSAKALADDLRNYLDGRPVKAQYLEAPARRTRSNRVVAWPVSVAIGLLVVGLIGTSLFLLRLESLRARDSRALQEAVATVVELSSTSDVRGTSGPKAHGQGGDRAWKRTRELALTLQDQPRLADSMAEALVAFADRSTVEGSDLESGRLWKSAIPILEKQARDRPDDLSTRTNLAHALETLASIEGRLGRASPSKSLRNRAIGLRVEIVAARGRIALQAPDDIDLQLDQAEATLQLDRLTRENGGKGDVTKADSTVRKAASKADRSPVARRRAANLLLELARIEHSTGDDRQALDAVYQALQLGSASSKGPAFPLILARSQSVLGLIYQDLRLLREAADHFREAAEGYKQLAVEEPYSVTIHREWGASELAISQVLLAQGRFDEAIVASRRALELGRSTRLAHLTTATDLAHRGQIFATLGSAFEKRGQPIAAAGFTLQAILDDGFARLLAPGEAQHAEALADQVKTLKRLIRSTFNQDARTASR